MPTRIKLSVRSGRSIAVAVSVSVALAWSTQSGSLIRSLPLGELASAIPYLRSSMAQASDVIIMLILVSLTARPVSGSIVGLTGIYAPPGRPVIWAALFFIPAFLVCLVIAPIANELKPVDAFWQGVGFPVIEEFVYRGLAIGVLMRVCGWPFLAACLWPAVFFGLGHAWQGSDIGSLVGIIGITGLGGLLFGWLFVRWNFNLWPAILLHIGLNTLWLVFDLGETALGGWTGNALRLLIIASAIAATFWLAPENDED